MCLDLRHCLNYVFSVLLKDRCEAPEYYRHLLVITRALMNSVLVITRNIVLAHVTESGENMREHSAEISKQAPMEEYSFLIRSRASIRSIHLVLQRSLSFNKFNAGSVFCIASSNFF